MIDQKTIQHIAKLARLKVTPEEATVYGDQLTKVLSHFQKISKKCLTKLFHFSRQFFPKTFPKNTSKSPLPKILSMLSFVL